MKKLQSEKKLQQKKKGNKIIYLLVGIFVALCAGRIFVANRLVDFSERLHNLDMKEARLLTEQEALSVQYSQVSSLTILREKALASGFVANPKVIYESRVSD